jgi:hypothetical protein
MARRRSIRFSLGREQSEVEVGGYNSINAASASSIFVLSSVMEN